MSATRAVVILTALLVAGAASTSTHTVEWGETLSGIASRLGVPVGDLAAANGITDPDYIRAGQTLQVPGAAPASPAVELVSASTGGVPGGAIHAVAVGENLASIARRYDTTVAELVRLNNIADPNYVRAGSTIVVSPAATWVCPVQGADQWAFIDSFGAPRPGGRVHQGIDIFATRGTPVVANVAGVLTFVQGANAGNAYYLDGVDGFVYYGAHLDTYARGEGQVAGGELIGTVGNTGNAAPTPPHLHFSMEQSDGTILNPFTGLRQAC